MDVWNLFHIGNPKYTTFKKIGSGTKLFITFELKVIRHEERERERDTIFLCWQLLHRQLSTQPTRGARSAQSRLASPRFQSQLSRSEAGTQLAAFSQIPKSSAHASVHDVIHLHSPISYLGFLFWHLWMTHPLRARVNTCINVAPY